jgi:hypothetical protein
MVDRFRSDVRERFEVTGERRQGKYGAIRFATTAAVSGYLRITKESDRESHRKLASQGNRR